VARFDIAEGALEMLQQVLQPVVSGNASLR
jgi:hypothetical protein